MQEPASQTEFPVGPEVALAFLEGSRDCVLVLDLDGRVLHAAQGGAYDGESNSAPSAGAGWVTLWGREHAQAAEAALAQARAGLVARFRAQKKGTGETGTWCEVTVTPIRDSKGNPKQLLSASRDLTEVTEIEAALRTEGERYRLAAKATNNAIWDWDLATDRLSWGEATHGLFGYGRDEVGQDVAWWKAKIHPEDRRRVVSSIHKAIRAKRPHWASEYRYLRVDGSYADVVDRGYLIVDGQGQAVRMVGAVQDVSTRKAAEDELRASELRLRLALGAARMVAWEVDPVTDMVTRSANSHELMGIGSGPSSEFLDRVHPDDRPALAAAARSTSENEETVAELRFNRDDGRTMWLEVRSVLVPDGSQKERMVGVCFDISERKAAEERVTWAATHDPLTGLPNRALFQSRFWEALRDATCDDGHVELLTLDLDGFKDINDTLGHHAGDALLMETAARLQCLVNGSGTVSRIAGDEFAIFVRAAHSGTQVASLAGRVLEELRRPIHYEGRSICCSASIGVASSPEHGTEAVELMKAADAALYAAKADGRDRVTVFQPAMREDHLQRITILGEIREALPRQSIVPYYQPKVCLSTGRLTGFEALARWRHPIKGLLTPGTFHAAFEDHDLATGIRRVMIAQVIQDTREWLDGGLSARPIAVNLAAHDFRDPSLADTTLSALRDAGVPASLFQIEVTETVFLGRGAELVDRTLRQFHQEGVRIALDDFGTGFASLTHLKQFPVSEVKIDRSFVQGLGSETHDHAIVSALVGLGKSLALSTIAEGVETIEQAQHLRELGCDEAQGYLFAKPLAGSRVPWVISKWQHHGAPSEPARLLA